ncbi:MAG: BTAD domain-containing putative transcriptional regulator [Actinomycetota bacterium]
MAGTERPFEIQVLGPLVVRRDGRDLDIGGPKPKLLLALLVARVGQVVSVDRLIDGLWDEDPPATARKAVQVHVSNLRRALGEDFPLRTASGGYLIGVDGLLVDAVAAEAAVDEAVATIRTQPATAARLADEALGRWCGPPLSGLEAEAVQATITRLDELRLQAKVLRYDARLRLGHHAEVLPELDADTAEHPFREDLRALHVLALYRCGRQADALRAYQRTRSALVEQLGVEPSAELRQLHQRILEQDPGLELDDTDVGEVKAFLATDIERSTDLWEADPDLMGEALERHDELARTVVAAHSGEVFKHTGDGCFAVFASTGDALGAAIELQTAIEDEHWPTDEPLRVRMAVDQGAATDRDGDWFGPVMNRVSRIMSSGHGGQLLVPEGLAARESIAERDLGEIDVRGVGRLAVAQVLADGLRHDFPALRADRGSSAVGRSGFGHSVRGYELREQLGEGAHSIVFRAYQASVGREVAVKVIRPEHANRSGFVRRFEAEAQYVAQLEHPHIVPLYDYWRDPNGAYLVMQWVRAGDLASALERSPWDPPATVRLLDQIGAALAYAHRHGVVHGDIKPANVLLDADGNGYLTDFGIASQHLLEATGPAATSSAAYLSPEELANEPIGPHSDVYAFGLLVNEILTGTRPALGGRPRPVAESRPGLPPALDEVLARATAIDPEARFGRIEDLLRALRRVFGADVTTRDVGDGAATPTRNPFKGLRAFNETDAADYFGREGLTEELVDHVATNRVTVVAGPSGSGKSSLVKAGLLPLARRFGVGGRDVVVTEMFPGSHPFEELEAALVKVAVRRPAELLTELTADARGLLRVSKQILPDDDTDLLLVIDQFEELYSLTGDDDVRRRFLDALTEVAADERSRLRIVATLRADFLDRPLAHAGFGAHLADGLLTVAMPGHDELARAIAEPARAAGFELEPGLVPVVTRDVADEPGALPLVQFALTELVEATDGSRLDIAAYEATGGVIGSVARRAEEIFRGLAPGTQDVAADLFVQLVAVDDASDDTRRRVRRSDLDALGAPPSAIEAVIADFGSFRLLSFDRDPVTRGQTVEVAHEALIREWPRLRGWIDDRRETLLLQRRLEAAALEWEESGRDPDFLLSGGRLEQYEDWSSSEGARLGDIERGYLAEGRDHEDALVAGANRRRRSVVGVLAVLTTFAVAVAAVALVQRERANDASEVADAATARAVEARSEAERLQATAEQAAREAQVRSTALEATTRADTDPAAAGALAIEAAASDDADAATAEIVEALWTSSRRNRQVATYELGTGFGFAGQLVDTSPDSELMVAVVDPFVATPTDPNRALVIDSSTGEVVAELADGSVLLDAAFDPVDGSIVSSGQDGVLRWWDARSGERLRSEAVADEFLWQVAATEDHLAHSRLIDMDTGFSTATVVDRTTDEIVVEVEDAWLSQFSPDGSHVATTTFGSEIVVHELPSGSEVARFEHDLDLGFAAGGISWVPGRDALWLLRLDGSVRLLDVATGETLDPWPGRLVGTDPRALSASPDGRFLAVGDLDDVVFVYDATTLEEVLSFPAPGRRSFDVDWSADGSRLVGADDGPATLWRLGVVDVGPASTVRTEEYPYFHERFGDDLLLMVTRRGRGELWDLEAGELVTGFSLQREVQNLNSVAHAPTGRFAVPADDGIRVYDVGSRSWLTEIDEPDVDHALAFSDDGGLLLASTSPEAIRGGRAEAVATAVLDPVTGRTLHRLTGVQLDGAVFLDGGEHALVLRFDGATMTSTVQVLDVASGELGHAVTFEDFADHVAVTPDGSRALVATQPGGLALLEVDELLDATATVPSVERTIEPLDTILWIEWSEDGEEVFLADVAGRVRALDGETLEERWSIDTGFVVSQARVRDGLLSFPVQDELGVGVGSGRFTIATIPTEVEAFAAFVASLADRRLTDDECRRFLGRTCQLG